MSQLPPGAVVWFEIKTLWRTFTVVLTNETACPDLEGLHGLTDSDLGVIWLAETLPYEGLVYTVTHELLHAGFSTPSEGSMLTNLLGGTLETAPEREECLVVHLTPRLVDMFVRSGLLTYPPLPQR